MNRVKICNLLLMKQALKQESTPLKGYFSFILLVTLFGNLALGFAVFLLKNSAINQAILLISVSFILMLTLFLFVLFTCSKKCEMIKKERALNQNLHKKNLSKTDFIKSASHDIKNYAFGISGVLKFILQNKSKDEIQASNDLKTLEELHLQSEELMNFVEDVFDINCDQLEDESLTCSKLYNVIDVARRMVILNKNFALKNRITLEIDNKTKSQLVKVECNVKRLKKVLNFLVRSAVKRSATNDIVILQLSVVNDKIQISVIDQGSEISENNSDECENYHNLSMLEIQNLIEPDHAKLEINSIQDSGNEVKITLPIVDQSDSVDQKCAENSIDNRFQNKSVLIAEDNIIANKIVTFLLRKMGFNVKHVNNGAEIIEQLDKQHFDLVFLDINMPQINGLETSKIIREGKVFKQFRNFDIPIIAISNQKQELSDLKNHGINMMIGKPFSEKELIGFVMEYVK